MSGRVVRGRGSPRRFSQTPCNKGPVSYRTNKPGLLVTISNGDAGESAEAVSRYAEQPVVDALSSDVFARGDRSRQPKPLASSAPKKQLAPSVAQLFSSVTQNRRSVRDEISELLDVYPQGIELSNFCHVYEKCFHRPFDSRWTDASSLRQMLESMVNLVECVEHGREVIVRRRLGTDYFQGNAFQS